MKVGNGSSAQLKANLKHARISVSQIIGAVRGLGYILAFPFAGLISALLLIGHCVKQRIVAIGRRAIQIIVRTQQE